MFTPESYRGRRRHLALGLLLLAALFLESCQPVAATPFPDITPPNSISAETLDNQAEFIHRVYPEAQNPHLTHIIPLATGHNLFLYQTDNVDYQPDQTAIQQLSAFYQEQTQTNTGVTIQTTDNKTVDIEIIPKSQDEDIITVIADTDTPHPSWSIANAVTTHQFTDQPYYLVVIRTDSLPDLNRSFATELCQTHVSTTATINAEDQEDLAGSFANWGQEMYCNSSSLAYHDATSGKPFETYTTYVGQTAFTPPGTTMQYSVWQVNLATYTDLETIGRLFK